MTAIPVRIILHGLIALVPQNGTDGAKMTALVIDTSTKPAGMECYMKHVPRIEFPAEVQACGAIPGCRRTTGTKCGCNLKDQEISILPRTNREAEPFEKRPARMLPFGRNDAGNFAYVPNLEELGYTLNQAFLSTDSALTPPSALAARFKFPFDQVASCNLVTRKEDGVDYAHVTNMRPPKEEEAEGRNELSQAVAQLVEASVAIEVNTGETLKLVLSPLPGRTGSTHEIELITSSSEVEITLSNERETHWHWPGEVCDDGIGRDFAFFFDLVNERHDSWSERPVPHVKYGLRKSISDLYPLTDQTLCKNKKGPMSRPICPMASFY